MANEYSHHQLKTSSGNRRIIDIVPILNEHELLKIRLYELRDVVDVFVIVEQNITHTGLAKPLVYPMYEHEFAEALGAKYMHKLSYYFCPETIAADPAAMAREREDYMRVHCMARALDAITLAPNDVVLIGDLDEIPAASSVAEIKNNPKFQNIMWFSFQQQRYHFNFFCASTNMFRWSGTVGVTFEHLQTPGITMQTIRDRRNERPANGISFDIPRGGWHFSNFPFGNASALAEKYRSFAETQTIKHVPANQMVSFFSNLLAKGHGDVTTNTQCEFKELHQFPRRLVAFPKTYVNFLTQRQYAEIVALKHDVHMIIPMKMPKTLEHLQELWTMADHEYGDVIFHFGIDWDDEETLRRLHTGLNPQWTCYVHKIFGRHGDVSAIANQIFSETPKHEYFFRCNDDTRMMTWAWNRLCIESLMQAPCKNVGLAKIKDLTNVHTQTHSFFSWKHRLIFGNLFPVHFKNWCEDDWIGSIYENYTVDPGVTIRHLANAPRYDMFTIPADVLAYAIAKGRDQLNDMVKFTDICAT